MMGRDGQITRVPQFVPMLGDVASIAKVELAFREPARTYPSDHLVAPDDLAWDNNYKRTHQAPVNAQQPSSNANTVEDSNYLLDFQRGWYKQASDVTPVLYRNAMMLGRPTAPTPIRMRTRTTSSRCAGCSSASWAAR